MKVVRTLDKDVVHRCAVTELFLTSAREVSDGSYCFGTQLPRRHCYYGDQVDAATGHDPLLLLEACRQASYAVFHEFHSIPLHKAFLLRDAEIEVLDPASLQIVPAALEAVLHARVVRRFRDRNRLVAGMRHEYEIVVGDVLAARATIQASWVEPERMRDMRAGTRRALGLPDTPPAPATVSGIDPARVDRCLPQNVVISSVVADGDDAPVATLAVDPGHPSFFDHPLDHVPGMLTVEACRQTVLAAPGASRTARRLDAIALRFHEFVELDLPVHCRVEPVGGPGTPAGRQVVVSQCERVVAEATVRMGEPARKRAGELLATR